VAMTNSSKVGPTPLRSFFIDMKLRLIAHYVADSYQGKPGKKHAVEPTRLSYADLASANQPAERTLRGAQEWLLADTSSQHVMRELVRIQASRALGSAT
jgi:hypothetical protein